MNLYEFNIKLEDGWKEFFRGRFFQTRLPNGKSYSCWSGEFVLFFRNWFFLWNHLQGNRNVHFFMHFLEHLISCSLLQWPRCPSAGCREEFRLADLEIHLSTCAHAEQKVFITKPWVGPTRLVGGPRFVDNLYLCLSGIFDICIDIRLKSHHLHYDDDHDDWWW